MTGDVYWVVILDVLTGETRSAGPFGNVDTADEHGRWVASRKPNQWVKVVGVNYPTPELLAMVDEPDEGYTVWPPRVDQGTHQQPPWPDEPGESMVQRLNRELIDPDDL